MRKTKALIAGAILAPTLALGQFDSGGGPGSFTGKKPWEELIKNPKTTVKLSLRNASIDSIVAFYQKASGVTIVKDPNLTGGLTVTSAKAVPLKQAFQILSTTLSLKGYELIKDDSLLVIRKKDTAPKFDWTSMLGNTSGGGSPWGGGGDEAKLEVYPITFANASQVARVINDVFAQAGGGFQFPGAGNFGGGGGGNFGGGGFQRGGAGGGANPFANFRGFGRGNQTTVRASADDFSNSVIVNAPPEYQSQVSALIKKLDKDTEEPQKSKVFTLKFAAADELQPVIQNVLTANVPRGRGGASTQQNQGPQAFISALRGNVAGAGNVVADSRTNSLVVTATKENLETVGKVVTELDTEVKYEPSTFVFPLSNARADNVATLVQQAFGQRQGVNGGNFGNRGNTTGRTTTNQNRNNQNRNNGGFGNEVIDPNSGQANSLPIDLQDPNATEGELMTSIAAQGFGGGFFGGGGQQRRNTNQNQNLTGRNAQGQLVNVRDLTGQVTAIPDTNTNSIIVVTNPENADLIRKILDQLDRIPEQVMIETIIVEATLDSTSRLGVEWKFANEKMFGNNTSGVGQSDFGQQTTPPQQGFRYTLSGPNLNAFINAFKSDSKFQVLSTPRIFTSNNVEAEINISQRVPYVTNSRQDVNGNFTFNYAFEDVGIVLTVTPRITSNGYVTMDVVQTANDLQGYTDFNAPLINQRSAQTTVSVRDGETIVLGGIIRSTVNATTRKIPLLGDLPVLGTLFKSTSKEKQKTELLVFLSPRVVRDPEDAARMKEQQQSQLSAGNQKALEEIAKLRNQSNEPPADPKGGQPKKSGGD